MSARDDEFEEVLALLGGGLRRVAESYSRSVSEREDLCQDICLAIWTALPRFRGESSKKTYVYRIAHNCALRHLAKRRRAPEGDADEHEELPSAAPSPEEGASANEARARLLVAIRKLQPGLRSALLLALEDMTHREIAEVLGISEGTVAVRLHRARAAVIAMLEEQHGRAKDVA